MDRRDSFYYHDDPRFDIDNQYYVQQCYKGMSAREYLQGFTSVSKFISIFFVG
jgi:hypothetical protein